MSDATNRNKDWASGKLAALALGAALWAGLPGAVSAHDFSTAILGLEGTTATDLAAAVSGFRIATRERDEHAMETSDGHLGGLDVYIIPLPAELGAGIDGLVGVQPDSYDFLVLLGEGDLPAGAIAGITEATIVVSPGASFDVSRLTTQPNSFSMRYQGDYGAAPNEAAAYGYIAARRIDQAVRPFGAVLQTGAIRDALAETATRINE
jgi:hypothetical protein